MRDVRKEIRKNAIETKMKKDGLLEKQNEKLAEIKEKENLEDK
jgi:hypothetical protein